MGGRRGPLLGDDALSHVEPPRLELHVGPGLEDLGDVPAHFLAAGDLAGGVVGEDHVGRVHRHDRVEVLRVPGVVVAPDRRRQRLDAVALAHDADCSSSLRSSGDSPGRLAGVRASLGLAPRKRRAEEVGMDVAIGLPNAVPGTTGGQLVEWARRADARGFSSLGTIDRIVYENYEPLTALAAAAAVTERIGLCTSVLLGPLRVNADRACQAGAQPPRALRRALHARHRPRRSRRRLRGERRRAERPRPAAGRDAGARSRRSGRAARSGPSIAGARPAWSSAVTPTPPSRARRASATAGSPAGAGPDQFAEMAPRRRRPPGRRPAATDEPRTDGRSPISRWAIAPRRRRVPTSPTTTPGSARRLPVTSSPAPPRMRRPSSSTSRPTRRPAATS